MSCPRSLNSFIFPISNGWILENDFQTIFVDVDVNSGGWCMAISWVAIQIIVGSQYNSVSDSLVDTNPTVLGASSLNYDLDFNTNDPSTTCQVQADIYVNGGSYISTVGPTSVSTSGMVTISFPASIFCSQMEDGP